MTQAFNLSQLANKVNTSGQLDASTGLVNITPVANGGTGRSSVTAGRLLIGAGTSTMTLLAGAAVDDVVTWNGTAWVSSAAAGGAPPTIQTFVAPGTYTKPAAIKGIKVIVVGAGGAGGTITVPSNLSSGGGGGGAAIEVLAAPALPGPVAVTAGAGTNSFGTFCSATAGSTGATSANAAKGGNGGSGSGGSVNLVGSDGGNGIRVPTPTGQNWIGGNGGNSILGGGGSGAAGTGTANGSNGNNYGGGGGGALGTPTTAGTGAPGIVIIEEFY